MPNETIYKYRQYCKTCEDYTVHTATDTLDEKLEDIPHICSSCQTEYTSIKLIDIPHKIRLEQQQRYREYSRRDMAEMYSSFGRGSNIFDDFFKPVSGPITKIIESDAGWKAQREREIATAKKIRDERNAELAKYKDVGRNDKCPCGSGNKYKHCHLKTHKTW